MIRQRISTIVTTLSLVLSLSAASAVLPATTLGALANSMWIMPIIMFIILFMRAGSMAITIGEALFVALQALTGPFSPFFLPLLLSFS